MPDTIHDFATSISYDEETTTDSYQTFDSPLDLMGRRNSVSFIFENTGGSNALKFKIEASNGGDTWVEVQAEEAVNSGEVTSYEEDLPAFRYYRVRFAANTAGSQTTAKLHVAAK